ncbi:ABC transporter permease [Ekhidna sp.]
MRKVLNPQLAEHIEGDLSELYEDYMEYYPKWRVRLLHIRDCLQMLHPLLLKSYVSNSIITNMLLNNFKLGYRNLLKYKNNTAINLVGLVLGLCTSITLYRVVQYEYSFDRFHTESENIYRVAEYHEKYGVYYQTRTPAAEKIKESLPEALAATRLISPSSLWLTYDSKTLKKGITYVDPDFATMFSFQVIEGDLQQTLDSKEQIAISLDVAKAYFGYENAVGKTLVSADGKSQYTVGAVLENAPVNSSIDYELILSWKAIPDWLKDAGDWHNTFMSSYVQMKPGVNPKSLDNKLLQIAKSNFLPEGMGSVFNLVGLEDFHSENTGNKATVQLLIIISGIISFIAFINFVNLSTAQSLNRIREVGIRKVMGSGKAEFIAQFAIESIILCVISGFIAIGISLLLTSQLNIYFSLVLPINLNIAYQITFGTLFIAITMGIIAGIYPSLYLAGKDIIQSLKGDVKKGSQKLFFQKILIVIQYTASIILIAATFIIWNQVSFMKNQNLELDHKRVIVIHLDYTSFTDLEKAAKDVRRFREVTENQPFVESIAFASNTPGNYDQNYNNFDDVNGNSRDIHLRQTNFSAGVVPTLGLDIIKGRNFDEKLKGEKDVVLINESAFDAFGWEDLENKEIRASGDQDTYQVIGVVKDFHYQSLAEQIEPMIYWYMGPDPVGSKIMLQYQKGSIEETIDYLKDNWVITGSMSTLNYDFLDTTFNELYESEERTGLIITLFSIVGIFLASLGLVALASFMIRQKTKEIGIRKVMGASSIQVAQMLSKRFILLVAIAIIISCPLIWYAGNEFLNNFSYRVDIGPLIFIISSFISIAIGVVSVGYRSYKAALNDPVDSLRSE